MIRETEPSGNIEDRREDDPTLTPSEKLYDRTPYKWEYPKAGNLTKEDLLNSVPQRFQSGGGRFDDAQNIQQDQLPKINPESWDKFITSQPESKNVEDKRDEYPGLTTPSNIDVNDRIPAINKDGSISTVRSITITEGSDLSPQRAVLLPTVINGEVVSNKEAIDHYRLTGEHLGKFKTEEEANRYAEDLHKEQEEYYSKYREHFLEKKKELDKSKEQTIKEILMQMKSNTINKK